MTPLSDNSWDCYLITIFACTNHNSGQQDAEMKINNQNSAAKTRVTTKRLLPNYLAVLVLLGSKYGWYSCTKSVVLKICKKFISYPTWHPTSFLLHHHCMQNLWNDQDFHKWEASKYLYEIDFKNQHYQIPKEVMTCIHAHKNVIRIATFYKKKK